MSGCCGQGPVILSGAAATPRLDVEAVLLCDVLPDGAVAGVALVEPVYDTNTGVRVATRVVDPSTGDPYTPAGELQACDSDGCNATTTALVLCDTAPDGTVVHFVRATTYDCQGEQLATLDRALDGTPYTATGTVGVCPASADCESPTTPVTSVGLCLADGTPIAVTVTRDCAGAVTSEGWLNLTTGAWAAGSVPAGTVACGDSRSIQVSGTFCDVDDTTGDVLGLVLVEYTYDDTGAIAAVRLVDAVTGDTYTPAGTVTVCPAGVEQPERDLLQLCDTATDGTVTPFVRDYARDENGAITGHADYALDGTSYTPAGTVGLCGATEACRDSSTVLVCDVPDDSSTVITPTMVDGLVADTGQTQFQNHPGPYTALWAGGPFLFPAGAGPAQEHLTATGQVTADLDGCDGAAGTLTISVRVRNDGPDAGQAWDGALRLFRGTTLVAAHNALEWAPSGWQGTLTVSAPVTAAEVAAGDIRVALTLETYHLGAKSWTADQFTAALELEGCEVNASTQFLRTLVTDCETGEVVSTTDTTLDGAPYTVTGTVGQCTPAATTDECRDCEQTVLCDITEEGTHAFLRVVCRDCTGAVVSVLDTGLDGTSPYAPVGTVGACNASAACETFTLCDSSPVPAELGAVALEDPSRWRTLICPACPAADNPTLPGGLQPLFDGGSVAVPLTPTSATTGSHHWAAGALTTSGCSCPDAEVALTVSVDFLNNGPAAQQGGGTGVFLYHGDTLVASDGTLAAAGTTDTLTVSGTVPLADVQAGNVVLLFQVEGGQQGSQKTWTLSNFQVEATTDCGRSFLRTVCRDAAGEVVSQTDTLDGVTAYAPVGDIQPCGGPDAMCDRPEPCETTGVQTIRLCDLDPSVEADEEGRRCAVPFLRHLSYGCTGELVGWHDTGLDGTTPYEPVQVVDCQCETGEGLTSSIEVPWQVVSVVEDPAGVVGQDFIYTVAPETDPARLGTIRVHVSRPAGGACGAYDINNLVFSNTSAYTLTLDAVAQEMSYLRVDLVDFDTFEPVAINSGMAEPDRLGGTAGWNAAHTRIVPSENNGTGYMYWDNPPETVGWTVFNQGGGVSCSALSFQGMTVEPGGCCGGNGASGCGECDTVVLCDVPAGGGAPVSFMRHVCRDCEGAVTGVTDTELDGITVYTPTGTVTSCGAVKDCPSTYGTECWELVTAQAAYDNTNTAGGPCGTITPNMTQCAGTFRINSWIVDGVERVVGAPPEFVAVGCGGNPNQLHGAWAAALAALDPGTDWQPAYNGVCLWYVRTNAANPDTAYGTMLLERVAGGTPAVYTLGSAQSSSREVYTKTFVEECDGTTTVQWLDADGNEIPEPVGDLTSCGAPTTSAVAPTTPEEAMPVGTAIRRLTGAGTFDAASVGVLQSVTVVVLAGSATVGTSDGTAEVPAGASLSWSVATGNDSAVAALTVTTDAADDVLVTATYK